MKHRKIFLSFLLALAMVVGLMPGMGLTAYAAPTETLLATITGAGYNANPATSANVSYSTEGVATLTLSGSVVYQASPAWRWWGYGWTATVTPAEGYTITKCIFFPFSSLKRMKSRLRLQLELCATAVVEFTAG